MKYVDEFRSREQASRYIDAITKLVSCPWHIMEICGGQTHSIVKYGIDQLLPEQLTLVHGPGCPVCVTPVGLIDKAIELALRPEVILASFGDMARVPGTQTNLLQAKARGARLQLVYSPLEALKVAENNPDKQVVFFAVGFETTAPTTAMAVYQAKQKEVNNFSMLVAHVLVPPAMQAILESPSSRIQGFLAAGHVCSIMGYHEYLPVAKKYHIPVVITGFEPLDILQGIYMCVQQLEQGRAEVENQYARAVTETGNETAQQIMQTVFQIVPRRWRGIGEIPESGLGFTDDYASFDAEQRFGLANQAYEIETECISGQVLQGTAKPVDCQAFGSKCTPNHPLGAPMVSSEGACAAYFKHRQHDDKHKVAL